MHVILRTVCALLLWLLPIHVFSDTLAGRVVRVLDGDTLEVLDQHHRVRLTGINAPESGQTMTIEYHDVLLPQVIPPPDFLVFQQDAF